MNLLSYGSKFDLWNYRTNVGSAYVVTRDAEIDPLGIGNMADQIEAQVGSYGGLKNSTAILEPNTTYYLVFGCIPQKVILGDLLLDYIKQIQSVHYMHKIVQ